MCRDLDLGVDDSPAEDASAGSVPLLATLVRALPEPVGFWQRLFGSPRLLDGVDVLYVHGWSDYFFQRRLARFWTDRGARFFALDLRRYGRSLRDGQLPGYIEDLSDYDAEIGLALEEMRRIDAGADPRAVAPAARRLILMGHSTGGLTLSLWADRNRGAAQALVLNSPWLELQVNGALRAALRPMVNLRARHSPHELAVPQLDLGFYKQAQRMVADPDEQALVNLDWRPEYTMPVRVGWLQAILAGHARVAAGLDVGAPACALLSARSQFGLSWRDEMLHADTVIEVESTARAALRLGPSVTVERIDGALHDVFLSEEGVRDEAYRRLDRWVAGWAVSHSRMA